MNIESPPTLPTLHLLATAIASKDPEKLRPFMTTEPPLLKPRAGGGYFLDKALFSLALQAKKNGPEAADRTAGAAVLSLIPERAPQPGAGGYAPRKLAAVPAAAFPAEEQWIADSLGVCFAVQSYGVPFAEQAFGPLLQSLQQQQILVRAATGHPFLNFSPQAKARLSDLQIRNPMALMLATQIRAFEISAGAPASPAVTAPTPATNLQVRSVAKPPVAAPSAADPASEDKQQAAGAQARPATTDAELIVDEEADAQNRPPRLVPADASSPTAPVPVAERQKPAPPSNSANAPAPSRSDYIHLLFRLHEDLKTGDVAKAEALMRELSVHPGYQQVLFSEVLAKISRTTGKLELTEAGVAQLRAELKANPTSVEARSLAALLPAPEPDEVRRMAAQLLKARLRESVTDMGVLLKTCQNTPHLWTALFGEATQPRTAPEIIALIDSARRSPGPIQALDQSIAGRPPEKPATTSAGQDEAERNRAEAMAQAVRRGVDQQASQRLRDEIAKERARRPADGNSALRWAENDYFQEAANRALVQACHARQPHAVKDLLLAGAHPYPEEPDPDRPGQVRAVAAQLLKSADPETNSIIEHLAMTRDQLGLERERRSNDGAPWAYDEVPLEQLRARIGPQGGGPRAAQTEAPAPAKTVAGPIPVPPTADTSGSKGGFFRSLARSLFSSRKDAPAPENRPGLSSPTILNPPAPPAAVPSSAKRKRSPAPSLNPSTPAAVKPVRAKRTRKTGSPAQPSVDAGAPKAMSAMDSASAESAPPKPSDTAEQSSPDAVTLINALHQIHQAGSAETLRAQAPETFAAIFDPAKPLAEISSTGAILTEAGHTLVADFLKKEPASRIGREVAAFYEVIPESAPLGSGATEPERDGIREVATDRQPNVDDGGPRIGA